jgi:hypothetical protein
MIGKKSNDPFTYHVMESINPEIRASFTPRQLEAVEEAISTGGREKNLSINLRGTIPLIFARYHLVMLMLRDRRCGVTRKEKKIKKKMTAARALLLSFFLCWPILLVLFLVIYFLKRHVGIDFMPGEHLFEMLGL